MNALAERLTRTFSELVRIDSPSYEEAAIADSIEGRLETLGFATWRDDADTRTPSETGNLFGRLPGLDGLPTVAFLAHMDTVEPGRGIEPVLEGDEIVSAGETILGADDKAAIAIILEAARTIGEQGHPHGDIVTVFTVAEEQGLVGAKAMEATALSAHYCYVLDAHGPTGDAVIAAPSQNSIRARIHGRAAHAGVDPGAGINAIAAAARAVAKMTLGRIDEQTTANIGRIQGGRASNIVPDLVELFGEARSHDPARLEEQTRAMLQALEAATAEGCTVETEVIEEYRAFAFSGEEPVVRLFTRACERAGLSPRMRRSGGGSDANVLNRLGVPALCLACGMEQVHSTDERVLVSELVAGHDLVLALVTEAMED